MKKHILCVEDEPDIARIVKFRLEHAGYEVSIAKNGAEALHMISEKPDLVLLDIVLPDIDGFEVCRKIRSDRSLGNIPVLFFTAQGGDREELKQKIRSAGGRGFIVKPFSPENLLEKVKDSL